MGSSGQTKIMIRTAGGEWRVPTLQSYANERGLQDILKEMPGLIPGVESRWWPTSYRLPAPVPWIFLRWNQTEP